MVNVRAPLMLLLLLLGSFLFRLWNMSQVFNACRMHSLPLTTECSALAREKERTSQRESDCALKRDSRRKRRAARSIHMFAIKCLWLYLCDSVLDISLCVFYICDKCTRHPLLSTHSQRWKLYVVMHMDVIIKVLRSMRHCHNLRTELKHTFSMKKL